MSYESLLSEGRIEAHTFAPRDLERHMAIAAARLKDAQVEGHSDDTTFTLAQDMLNAVRPSHQKLICFADNRQDAAFQAGWMQDHARRYRLRHLIHEYMRDAGRPVSIGDIQDELMRRFQEDRELARSLAPEVFEGRVEESFSQNIQDNLRYYVRIALVSELTTSFKQRESLETWGVARAVYQGVQPDDPDVIQWAAQYGWSPEELCGGISTLLDVYRRSRHFHDEGAPIFGRWWREGDQEIIRGYLPYAVGAHGRSLALDYLERLACSRLLCVLRLACYSYPPRLLASRPGRPTGHREVRLCRSRGWAWVAPSAYRVHLTGVFRDSHA